MAPKSPRFGAVVALHPSRLLRLYVGRLSSSATHGSRSSVQMVISGGNGTGSSSDAIVTSTFKASGASSKNKCVPQHAANDRTRFACGIFRSVPLRSVNAARSTLPHVTKGAPLLRRQSMQWQSFTPVGTSPSRYRTPPHKHPPSITGFIWRNECAPASRAMQFPVVALSVSSGKTCPPRKPPRHGLSRKPGNQEKSVHGFLASEFPSSAFLRVSGSLLVQGFQRG
jgi:hypothetical protein